MKANETKVEDFLSANKTQFIIPVYQRNYDWSLSQCKQLLGDILEVGQSRDLNVHFIGSVVFIHDDVYTSSRIKELSIIDGQQRLTTLTLIYLALLHLAKELGNEGLMHEISETYLINKFAPEEEKLKLRPTENNDRAIKYLLRGDFTEEYSDYSRVIENYTYFRDRITQENHEYVLMGLSKLIFVEISLDRGKDDPQRIFESLNSTGLELSQADLIRNYILMGLRPKDQKRIYLDYWQFIENSAKDEIKNVSKVSDFIRDYLTLSNKKIPNKSKVYQEFKLKYPISSLEELKANLHRLKSLVKYYNKLLNPFKEKDLDIRRQLTYINRLEINVTYPFLIKVYEDYGEGLITKGVFIEVLELVQSFTWRRFVVGLPTNALNKIFMVLYEKIDHRDYLDSLLKWLLQRSGSQRFPKDAEVVESLRNKDVYNIKSKNRAYLLERLENYDNREFVDIDGNPNITIEHIFPQTPEAKWKAELGADIYDRMKENYLHTLPNLTLSGNNGKLGNKYFVYKRDLEGAGYKDSRLWLNKYLSTIDRWDETALLERSTLLTERCLLIWQYPDIQIEDEPSSEVNIFEAEEPKHKKLEYVIFFDQKIEVSQVARLYEKVFTQLFDLQPETFFVTDLGERIALTKKPADSLRQPVSINENYCIEANLDSNGRFDRIKYALTIFGFEDELLIKYAE